MLLGIDVSMYSSKGVLVETDRTMVKTAEVEHAMSIPHPGWAEQDAEAIWWGDVVKICRILLSGDPYRSRCGGSNGQRDGMPRLRPFVIIVDQVHDSAGFPQPIKPLYAANPNRLLPPDRK
jgi:hypothetical protein